MTTWWWIAAWLGLMALGVANGVLRGLTYEKAMDELAAHQISSVLCAGLMFGAALVLERIVPLPSAAAAWTVGAAWLGLTVAFEFVFGRLVAGASWKKLLADYDVTRGRLWVLVPAAVFFAPRLAMVFD